MAVLVEHELPSLGVPQIVCEDARTGMALLADALYGHPSGELDVVGVTGTNGKTTTTLLVAAILDAAQRPCGLIGTVERRIGGRREPAGLTTPEAPDLQRTLRSMLEAGDEACAMEASSIAIAQRRLVGTRVRGGRLHEPLAGPPRLPRRPRALLRGQGLALRRALPARRQR